MASVLLLTSVVQSSLISHPKENSSLKLKFYNMVHEATDQLFISGVRNVIGTRGHAAISRFNITHVLTVTNSPIANYNHVKGVTYKFINAVDLPNFDIVCKLTEGVEYIEDAIANGGNVLVHCEMGISRSGSFVAAYIMKKFNWSPEQAVSHINKVWQIVQPNGGFMEQLQIFQSLNYLADATTLSASKEYRAWCGYNGLKPAYALPTQSNRSAYGEKQTIKKSEDELEEKVEEKGYNTFN